MRRGRGGGGTVGQVRERGGVVEGILSFPRSFPRSISHWLQILQHGGLVGFLRLASPRPHCGGVAADTLLTDALASDPASILHLNNAPEVNDLFGQDGVFQPRSLTCCASTPAPPPPPPPH